jgi:hypothetical protein
LVRVMSITPVVLSHWIERRARGYCRNPFPIRERVPGFVFIPIDGFVG